MRKVGSILKFSITINWNARDEDIKHFTRKIFFSSYYYVVIRSYNNCREISARNSRCVSGNRSISESINSFCILVESVFGYFEAEFEFNFVLVWHIGIPIFYGKDEQRLLFSLSNICGRNSETLENGSHL